VLIRGTSGIGKSECSLELISRGHKLVADDYVILRLEADNTVIGTSGKDWVCGIMQVKGIGIINVNNIFGITSWEKEKQVHLAIELVEPADVRASQEISMSKQYLTCLGMPLPLIRMPVHKGRNIALIIEVAVKNHILTTLGHDDQQLFLQRQEAMLLEKHHDPPERPRLVFVTGLSGSGKSTVLRALEDANFYCVDNLPSPSSWISWRRRGGSPRWPWPRICAPCPTSRSSSGPGPGSRPGTPTASCSSWTPTRRCWSAASR